MLSQTASRYCTIQTMLKLLVLAVALPLLAMGVDRTWDPRYARLQGVSQEGEVLVAHGTTYDGSWDCPWHLDGFECANGEFKCTCKNGATAKFSIGCCYHFPSCGRMCHNWGCSRYTRCNTCKSKVGEWDMKACASCIPGYVYENGLCDTDLNECGTTKKGGCEQKCHNTYGSYYCSCEYGFKMNTDKRTCTRLACPAISSTTQIKVTPTNEWLYYSWAKFETTDKALTLIGPELIKCEANSQGVYWAASQPIAADTCTSVEESEKKQCPNTGEGTTEEKCKQLGCCYKSGSTPSCFVNPEKSYIRYGGIAPVASEEKGFKVYKDYGTDSCIHRCQTTHKGGCKTAGYKTVGNNITNGVEFHECYMLSKSKGDLDAEKKLIPNAAYSMYEPFDNPAPYQTDIPLDAGLSKQLIGCYNDNQTSRDLPHHVLQSMTHMTPSMCVELCRAQRYKYAGIQNGADCYCGSQFYRKYGESESCDVPCSGDSSLTCGGVSDNSIYSIAWTDKYQGCYKDDSESHDLPFFVWGKDAGRSAGECMDECVKRGYTYAGLQDGGVCYCGNTFGRHGSANESDCSSNCYGYSRQNCGGSVYNAVYKTKTVATFADPGSSPYRLYDASATLAGISTTVFTLFPTLQSILSKRLVIHSSTKVITPADDTCGEDCYKPCGEIYQETHISNKGTDVTLRFFYINLSDLDDYVGDVAKRVFVHAQTVVIDRDINLGYALSLRAHHIIMDRSRAYYINVPSDAQPFDLDVEEQKFFDPEPDTLHQKQSIMCARILLDTLNTKDTSTAFGILNDVSNTQTQIRETRGVISIARDLVVDIAGLSRDNVRYVPFYTKSHVKLILDNYAEKISIYQEQLEKLLEESNTKDEILDYVEGMHDIYSETNILEANTQFEAATDAVEVSNATYHRFRKDYNESRDSLEEARKGFEAGLEEKKKWEIGKFLINVIASVAKATLGGLEYDKDTAEQDIDGIKVNIQELFALMQELSDTIAQIDELSDVVDKVIAEIELVEKEFDSARFYDDVEMSVQLQVNIVKWKNLKNYGETLLTQDDVAAVRGCSEYHRHLLDVCNWGEALTRSMVERSEMIREAMKKRMILDLKKEQKKRIDDHIQKYRNELFSGELLINEMVEQSYDTRLDLNEALLTFCQAYFYENMFDCKPAYKPSFGGSLEDLLLKVNAAKRDDLLIGSAPSTLRRYITVEDTDTDADCNDATQCPINYLRKHRLLYLTVPTNHSELADMDAYKVSELIITFNGAKKTTNNEYLKIQIESSGDFRGRADGTVHNFMTRALSLVFEYSLNTNHITVHADVYAPFRNIIQHITPFTTWVMRVSDIRSNDIDLSEVTSVRIQFNGSGVDNETWKKMAKAARGE